MSNNEKNSELTDDFIKENIKRIKELYEAETFLEEKILKTNVTKNEMFVLFDKEWLIKWKKIVDYENLKVKCKNCEINGQISRDIIDEVRLLFIENNTKKKLDDLGKMNGSKMQKKIDKKDLINEKSNFIPILSHQCVYFGKAIEKSITVKSEISNGVIYIHDLFPVKNKEQKLILLYKDPSNNQEFIKPIITLNPNINI